jgi:hypothetical protein
VIAGLTTSDAATADAMAISKSTTPPRAIEVTYGRLSSLGGAHSAMHLPSQAPAGDDPVAWKVVLRGTYDGAEGLETIYLAAETGTLIESMIAPPSPSGSHDIPCGSGECG